MNKYSDIINLEHDISIKHPRMSIEERSAIFASFKALSGYSDSIEEEGRLTSLKKELSVDETISLNDKLNKITPGTEIKIIYFIKDNIKQGGKYIEEKIMVKRIDNIKKEIITNIKKRISIEDILDIKDV